MLGAGSLLGGGEDSVVVEVLGAGAGSLEVVVEVEGAGSLGGGLEVVDPLEEVFVLSDIHHPPLSLIQ